MLSSASSTAAAATQPTSADVASALNPAQALFSNATRDVQSGSRIVHKQGETYREYKPTASRSGPETNPAMAPAAAPVDPQHYYQAYAQYPGYSQYPAGYDPNAAAAYGMDPQTYAQLMSDPQAYAQYMAQYQAYYAQNAHLHHPPQQ